MFFNNAVIFTFPNQDSGLFDDLESALEECRLAPIGPLELSRRGFVAPMGGDATALHYRSGDGIWLTIGGEDRILPSSAVNKRLKDKLAEIREKEGREPGGRTRKRLKDEIMTDMIPKAFTKPYRCDMYVNLRLGICVVNTSSRNTAESAVSELRRALGSFPALPVNAEVDPSGVLTALFAGEQEEEITLGADVELKDPVGDAVIRASKEDLHDKDLLRHLENGKRVIKLGLNLGDRLGFVMGADLITRKLQFYGASADMDENTPENVEQELSARFILFHAEFDAFYVKIAKMFKLTSALPLFDKPASADAAVADVLQKVKLKVPALANGELFHETGNAGA